MNVEHIPTTYEIDRAMPDHCAEPIESQIYLWCYFNYHPRLNKKFRLNYKL